MTIIFVILAIIVGIIAMFLITALFVKKEFAIKRDIIINRSASHVYDYVRLLTNQDYFSKWVMKDPTKKKEHRGVDGTVGFVYAWNGNNEVGEGEQEIIGLTSNEKVDIEVRFVRPFKSTARTPFTIQRISERQTKITWGMEGRSKYPMNLMYLFMAGTFEKDLDTSLTMLKNNLEQTNAAPGRPEPAPTF